MLLKMCESQYSAKFLGILQVVGNWQIVYETIIISHFPRYSIKMSNEKLTQNKYDELLHTFLRHSVE